MSRVDVLLAAVDAVAERRLGYAARPVHDAPPAARSRGPAPDAAGGRTGGGTSDLGAVQVLPRHRGPAREPLAPDHPLEQVVG